MEIRSFNFRPHADIEVDIQTKKNGQVTLTLRCNAGNIVDYSSVEYIDVKKKYGGLKQTGTVVITEP